MAKLMEGVLIVAIAGMVVWYGGGTLWQAARAAHPPPEPTTLDQVRDCGYEGRQRVREPTAECGAVFEDALRQLGAQQVVLAVSGSHRADEFSVPARSRRWTSREGPRSSRGGRRRCRRRRSG